MRAVSSVVERLPYKQVVTGSSPVPPNITKPIKITYHKLQKVKKLTEKS